MAYDFFVYNFLQAFSLRNLFSPIGPEIGSVTLYLTCLLMAIHLQVRIEISNREFLDHAYGIFVDKEKTRIMRAATILRYGFP